MTQSAPDLLDIAFDRMVDYRSRAYMKTRCEVSIDLRNEIVEQVHCDSEFRTKLDGMMLRNNIPLSTRIQEDVLQEISYQLCKSSPRRLVELHCDSYRRIFGLAMRIATRAGFGKMNKDIHQNASVAKQMTYKSNLNQRHHLSSTDDEVLINDKVVKLPTVSMDEDMWDEVRSKLTQEELAFLDFLLDKVMSKKYKQSYPMHLRREAYSLNEYKILRLALQHRIREIITKNK